MRLCILDPDNDAQPFPDVEQALTEPNGLVAVGGCLSPRRLLNAYRHGVFPWFNPGEPILWWAPNPRLVVFPSQLKVSRSLNKAMRKQPFEICFDRAFEQVIEACSAPREQQSGTWITDDMKCAYIEMHQLGIAHSVEAWQGDQLVGGLYGIGIGQVFFGESMFHRASDASKIAFVHLVRRLIDWDYQLIDCQVSSDHLLTLGATEIPRREFSALLHTLCVQPPHSAAWRP